MNGECWQVPRRVRAKMVEAARRFRKSPTPSEATLWQALRGRRLDGRRFRRQQPMGPFVVDFFNAAERLIVEVDGPIHESQRELDAERQRLLEGLGLRFLRLSAALVETDLPSALDAIRRACDSCPAADQGDGGTPGTRPLSRASAGKGH